MPLSLGESLHFSNAMLLASSARGWLWKLGDHHRFVYLWYGEWFLVMEKRQSFASRAIEGSRDIVGASSLFKKHKIIFL